MNVYLMAVVHSLQKLQEKLNEMERELRSIRQEAQNQERTIQGLTESSSTKDREVNIFLSFHEEIIDSDSQLLIYTVNSDPRPRSCTSS